jgi:hypothetical protein
MKRPPDLDTHRLSALDSSRTTTIAKDRRVMIIESGDGIVFLIQSGG